MTPSKSAFDEMMDHINANASELIPEEFRDKPIVYPEGDDDE